MTDKQKTNLNKDCKSPKITLSWDFRIFYRSCTAQSMYLQILGTII